MHHLPLTFCNLHQVDHKTGEKSFILLWSDRLSHQRVIKMDEYLTYSALSFKGKGCVNAKG